MVKVLPDPVWPYAKIDPLYPSRQLSATGCAMRVKISYWGTLMSAT